MNEVDQLQDAVAKARRGKDNAKLHQALTALANYYRDAHDWDGLTATVEERHALERRDGGSGLGLVYLAGDLARAGRGLAAIALLERSERELRNAGIADTAYEWQTLYDLRCEVSLAMDELDNAISACRRSVAIARRVGPEYSNYWEMHAYLGDLLQFRQQDVAGAVTERVELWHYFRGRLQELAEGLNYNAAIVHVQNGARLAHGFRQLGQDAKAVPVYEALIADLEESRFFGPEAIEVPTLHIDLAECLKATGDVEGSRRHAQTALDALAKNGHADPSLESRARDALGSS